VADRLALRSVRPGYVTEVDASKHFIFAFKNVHIFDPWEK